MVFRNKKGYTLIEMVVAGAISLILLSAVTVGIVQYSRYANFKRQNDYAMELFTAAQEQLTSYSQRGTLTGLQTAAKGYRLDLDLTEITDSNGVHATSLNIWGTNVEAYQGQLRYLIATAQDYQNFINNKLNDDDARSQELRALYGLFDAYLYNKSILNATICVEFDPYDGLVYSVLYSDEAEKFVYSGETTGKTVNICDRRQDIRKENMVGYYGVDTLSKATSTEAQKPALSTPILNNEETLNLTFRLNDVSEATSKLIYEVIVYDASSNQPLLSIVFNDVTLNQTESGLTNYNYLLVAEDSLNANATIMAKVENFQHEERSGLFVFPAWVDKAKTVHFVLDAADLGATAAQYTQYTEEENLTYSNNPLKDTYSLHRLGISTTNIYCTVQGSGSGFKTTAKKQSTTENSFFGKYSSAANVRFYTLYNARHLYNLRFEEAKEHPDSITYTVTQNISWMQLINAGALYRAQATLKTGNELSWLQNPNQFTTAMLKVSSTSSEAEKSFPSISELLSNSTLQSNSSVQCYSVGEMSIFTQTNVDRGLSADSTGLFLKNSGTIQNLIFDNIGVKADSNSAGTVCGINNGTLNNLMVSATCSVSGNQYVGGITGSQSESKGNGTVSVCYDTLVNRSSVTGNQYVGGIIGELKANNKGSITVQNCKNYGQLFVSGETGTAQFFGGIAGYIQQDNGNESILTVKDCTSSPQYSWNEVETLVYNRKLPDNLSANYVGGIVGYNKGASLKDCDTVSEEGKTGYVIGNQFVGGIVGYNEGVASSLDGSSHENQANVIGNKYVGGIVGANTSLDNIDNPDAAAFSVGVSVQNWLNRGVVIAFEKYAGGITGYNTGMIQHCSSDVDYDETVRKLTSVDGISADYVGGIAGYNNGKIYYSSDNSTVTSVVAVVTGHNFVGGVVGYNDCGTDCELTGYELQGGYIFGEWFVGGFVGLNTSVSFLSQNDMLQSNPNEVKGTYCVGGVIGSNIVCPSENIQTKYNAYNILGNVEGSAFVGGFIGYNLLVENPQGLTDFINADFPDKTYSELVNYASSSNSNYVLQIGDDTNSVVELRGISADYYVGGVVGYNAENTNLYIYGVTNRTPIIANKTINDGHKITGAAGLANESTITGYFAYAGGITGLVSKSVVIDQCSNGGAGKVTTNGTYLGGLAEVNYGLIANCTAVSTGSDSRENVGGLVGLNFGGSSVSFGSDPGSILGDATYVTADKRIQLGLYSCKFSETITGKNYVGGLAAFNYGMIYDPIAEGTVTGYGTYVGGIVGCNSGKITLLSSQSVTVNGNGTYVGGIAGTDINTLWETNISVLKDSDAAQCTITSEGNISGQKFVGGIVGKANASLAGLVNVAPITATNGSAGGIAGEFTETTSDTKIENCANYGAIQATLSGNCGGIITDVPENCRIISCTNSGTVTSSKGGCGGIAATNQGKLDRCVVVLADENQKTVTFWEKIKEFFFGSETHLLISGNENAGALAAKNSGTITNCSVSRVHITNMSSSAEKSFIGGFVGENNGTIELLTGSDSATQDQVSISDVVVSTYSNHSSVGGIAGVNSGKISGLNGATDSRSTYARVGMADALVKIEFSSSSPTTSNFGGLAGENSGTIQYCAVQAYVDGRRGNSSSPTNGYGGVAGVNSGTISDCEFDGTVYADGNSSFIACVGGIAGLNEKLVENCLIGVTEGGKTIIQCGSTTTAYGYVGGMVGHNRGILKNSNNFDGSKASVYVLNYAGHTGGLVGRNHNQAVVTGEEAHVTSTGEKWEIVVLNYDNDCGAAGIMGYSASGVSFEYVENYADVFYMKNSRNVSTGGMIGRIENSENNFMLISHCANYGTILARGGLVGGFFGTVKYNGLSLQNCMNYGNVGSSSNNTVYYYEAGKSEQSEITSTIAWNGATASGFISRAYQITTNSTQQSASTINMISCENHGAIYGSIAAGYFCMSSESNSLRMMISNSINTGVMYGSSSAAGFVASANISNLKFYHCSNYGLCGNAKDDSFAGIYYGGASPTIQDCFDYSNAISYPIAKNASSSSSENYYVRRPASTVEKFVKNHARKIISGALSYTGNISKYELQSDYPISNLTDGNTNVAANSARWTATFKSGSTWSSGDSVNMDFALDGSANLHTIGICWGNNGEDNITRRYTYRFFYWDDSAEAWVTVTDPITNNNGTTTEYIGDGENGYYVACGTNDVRESNYNLTFGTDEAGNKKTVSTSKLRIQILKVESSSNATSAKPSWTDNKFVIISEIFALADENVKELSSADPDCKSNIGEALYPENVGTTEDPDYSKLSTASGSFAITGLTQDTSNFAFRDDFATYQTKEKADAESGSIRYRLYYDVKNRLFAMKYKEFNGTITVEPPTDAGGNSYTVKWTSTEAAYAYKVAYKKPDGTYSDEIVTNNNYQTVNIAAADLGKSLTFSVCAVYYDEKGQEQQSKWFEAQPIKAMPSLPTPQIHLELVNINRDTPEKAPVYRYKVVLDNVSDYAEADREKITITISEFTNISFSVKDGESSATIKANNSSNAMIAYQATSTLDTYSNSVKRVFQTFIFNTENLYNTKNASTGFKGFFGSTTKDTSYSLTLGKSTEVDRIENYYLVDLIAFDSLLNCQDALSYSELHVTNQGAVMTATLSNLPTDMISQLIDDYKTYQKNNQDYQSGKIETAPTAPTITVRTYPWRSQANICYFGYIYKSNVAAGAMAEELKDITNADGTFKENGYVIQKNHDGTYNIIYNVMLANSIDRQIDSAVYSILEEDGAYYLTSSTNNYKVLIQTAPVISKDFTYDSKTDQFTFSWTSGDSTKAAQYHVTLYGIKMDAGIETEVEISSFDTTENSASFTDDNWTYPDVRLVVERIGTQDADGKTTAFASSSDMAYNLKVRLQTISAPTVEFHIEDGVVEKDNLYYDVKWNGIVNPELYCYEISVRFVANGKNYEARFYPGDTEKIMQSGVYIDDVLDTTMTAALMRYDADPANPVAEINLNCFAEFGGQLADVSVRAISKKDATTYRSGLDGVPRTITLPERLSVPNLENLVYSAAENSVQSVLAFTTTGVRFDMKDSSYTSKGSYQMVLEVVDKDGAHIADVLYNGNKVDETNPITMSGNLNSASYSLTSLSAEYAGMWVKVKLRAISDSNISSVWTESILRPLPKVQVPTPTLEEGLLTVVYKHKSESEADWDRIEQPSLSFNTVDYAKEYVVTIVGAPEEVKLNEEENHQKSEVYRLRFVPSADGTWQVYFKTTNSDEYGTDVEVLLDPADDEGKVELPITREIFYKGVDDAGKEDTLVIHAYAYLQNPDVIQIALPDYPQGNNELFTQNVTVQAIAADAEHYVDSQLASWYRYLIDNDTPSTSITTVEKMPDAPELTENMFTLTVSERENTAFELAGSTSNLILVKLSVKSTQADEPDFVRIYSVPGNSLTATKFDSLLLLDNADWARFAGQNVSMEVAYIVSQHGISLWSNPLTVKLPELNETSQTLSDVPVSSEIPASSEVQASSGTATSSDVTASESVNASVPAAKTFFLRISLQPKALTDHGIVLLFRNQNIPWLMPVFIQPKRSFLIR